MDNQVAAPGPVGDCPGEHLLTVCDFDGTVSSMDTGNAFLERFAEGWEDVDCSYSAGEVGSRI
jgi:2-hydroxy-3-keto-5-methylthiopentenyl-1-phosphate phosphatase